MTNISTLLDNELLAETARLAANERLATAHLIAALAELDARKLYLGEGCSSLFVYCTRVLRLSEQAAYSRIEAARAARRFPVVLDLLAEGAITLTTVTLLAPHLTADNHREALEAARHKSKREVEAQVAARRPLPPVASSIRKVPERQPSPTPPTASGPDGASEQPIAAIIPGPNRPVVKPLAPESYKIQFTISRDTYDRLRRAQDLLRHSIPDGDPAKIFDRALTLLLEHAEKKKLAAAARPRMSKEPTAHTTRHIPAAVKREVWRRDEGRCAFIGAVGRCDERGFLEFHHRQPFARGGEATVENLELRCRAHNAYEADLFFGPSIAGEDRAEYVANSVRTEFAGRMPDRTAFW